ncbi:MAG TPA: hypothetical protein VF395_05260 [Polyangiaceae bacterium]
MRRILFHRLVLPVALFVGAGGCSQTGTSTTLIPETALMVDPSQFLGKVTCGSGPDAMHSFVATVVDVSGFQHSISIPTTTRLEGGLATLALPSSGPTSCFQSVLFERIVVGRQYAAEIDGYDRSDIEAIAPGSRVMVDRATRTYVPPRWRTACSSHWFDPRRGRTLPLEAGALVDARVAGDAGVDAHVSTPATTSGPTVVGRPDAIAPAGTDCRGHKYLDGGPSPWLNGPVCAALYDTIVLKGCDPLTDAR